MIVKGSKEWEIHAKVYKIYSDFSEVEEADDNFWAELIATARECAEGYKDDAVAYAVAKALTCGLLNALESKYKAIKGKE